ncbi:hypothetical protein GN316_03090 [Xylophilus sp. Kf1]|nr:hypothetical protein [Xylophilus sp. Kf1]
MNQDNTPPADESDGFKAIRNMGQEVDDAAHQTLHGAPPAGAALVVADPAANWAVIPKMVGGMLCMALPELTPIYSEENCLAWGTEMARLAAKRGWETDGLPPEVSVLVVSAVFVVPTTFAIKARTDQRRRMREAAAGQQQPQNAGEPDGTGPTA